ncbi:lysosome-associated membrane glycoprotein 3 [Hypomesus transpacificus]|uniref:lysosome-associated membrane glycoprotein 3 n=1 Tax=Hypomesus transpacificus TaxID=137520 RepID=UPI001F087014|nr:lysosome-associated membrane glycoprotein 3 [Hypomesus transpacificus]
MEHEVGYLLLAGLMLGTCIVAESSREVVAESSVEVEPDNTFPFPAPALSSNGSQSRELGNLPVLQPSESVPTTGTFTLKDPRGNLCLKVTMGVEYIVIEKKKPSYFNLDPKTILASGFCTTESAVLSLGFSGNGGSLTLTFKKEGSMAYVSGLNAHITPEPCKGCPRKDYPGVMANEKLFLAPSGKSFKCNSQTYLVMAEELKLKIQPLQVQAFSIPKGGTFGEVVECWADFNKRVIPIIVGAVVVGLLLIAVITFLVIRDRRRQGYERLGS